jgi:hypothetical protein
MPRFASPNVGPEGRVTDQHVLVTAATAGVDFLRMSV